MILLLLHGLLRVNQGTAQATFGGTTTELGSGCYQLTGLVTFSGGYVYEQTPLNLNDPFDLTIPISLGDNNGGADGVTFVLRGDITTFPLIGSSGGAIGFSASAFASNALGVEVDTWQNVEFGDPVEDHIGIFRDGLNDHTSTNALAGPIQADANDPNVEDGAQHNLRIVFDPIVPELQVYFDCTFRLSYTGDLIDSIFNGDSLVHWGILGTTGGGVNTHTMCMPEPLNNLINDLDELQACGLDSVQLNAGAPQIEYLWQPGTGLSDSTIADPWHYPQDTITYTIRRIYACDTSYDTLFINADAFSFTLGNDTGICAPSFQLTGPPSANNYEWNTGDTTQNISITQSGVYLLIAGNEVCSDTDSIRITLSFVDLPDALNLCEDEATLSVDASGGDILWSTNDTTLNITVNSDGRYWVSLSNSDCTISDTVDVFFRAIELIGANDTVLCQDSIVMVSASRPADFLWSTGGVGNSITLSESDSLWVIASNTWCADTDSFVVQVEAFEFVEPIRLLCDVESINETLSAGTDTAVSYNWNTGSTSSAITVNQTGIYIVSISTANCNLTDSVEIRAASTPRFSLGEDQLICLGEAVIIHPDTVWSNVTWSNGSLYDSITVNDTGLYSATMENDGCVFSDTIEIRRFALPQDPRQVSSNFLTPNQDGINDRLGLINIDPRLITNYRFEVFNRWGASVFESRFINHQWDGALPSGEPASSGVYYFIIEAETKCDDLPRIEVKDHVTLLR
jgi:gliding motility-associated-like protein